MNNDRIQSYRDLEKARQSKLLLFITGDRQGMETIMHPEVIDRFVDHLDTFENCHKITLFLHSRGGDTSAGWSLANLIRSFCDEFEVIVPVRAHSAATLLSLGADKIIMTKQATLGPIDPSVNSPLNPIIQGSPNARVPVSVESIKGFIQLAKEELGITESGDMAQVLNVLANNVHPLVLGNVFRARTHIRMLAKNLLEKQFKKTEGFEVKIEKIVNFLCSDSGSHDYTINRKEAREELELTIEKPDQDLYKLIMAIYRNIEQELELKTPFNPALLLTQVDKQKYCCRRALIESLSYGTDVFISEGFLAKQQVPTPNGIMLQIQDNRTFEGWRKENV